MNKKTDYKAKILVMDDEEIIIKVAGRILKNLGYIGEFASNSAEAVKLYKEARKSNKSFDIVILDLTIPGGMGGEKTLDELIEIDPNVKVLASSGYSNSPIMSDFEKYHFKGALAKPYTLDEMKKAIALILEGKNG